MTTTMWDVPSDPRGLCVELSQQHD